MRVRHRSARRRRRAARPWAEGPRTQRHRCGSRATDCDRELEREPRQARRTAARRASALAAEVPKGQLFAPTSVWNQRVPSTTALDPNSGVLVAALVAEVQRERRRQSGRGSASARAAPRSIEFRADSRASGSASKAPRFTAAGPCSAPSPRCRCRATAKPAPGADRHLTVWQPSTDRLWEFFGARHAANGWHAQWGGAIRRVSKNPGYYTRAAWPAPRATGGRRRAASP